MPSNENSPNSHLTNLSTKYSTIFSAKSITWSERSSSVQIDRRARHPRCSNRSSVRERRPNSCKVKETFPDVQNNCPSICIWICLLPQLLRDSFYSVVDRSAINVTQQLQFLVNRGNHEVLLRAIPLSNWPFSHRTLLSTKGVSPWRCL